MAPGSSSLNERSQAWTAYWASGALHSCAGSYAGNYGAPYRDFWRGVFATLTPGERVLDLCCGNAPLPKMLLEERPQLRGRIGIDAVDAARVAPAWVAALPEAERAAIRVHAETDAAALPFDDASFDLCLSQFGIEYAGAAAWREAARVLRPGAELAAVVHHAEALPVRIAREELTHLDWLERQDGLLALAEAMLEPMARSGDPAELPRLRADADAAARRSAFNACQTALDERAAEASYPDALHETRHAVFVVLQVARESGLDVGREAFARLRDDLARMRLRQFELLQAARDEVGIRALCDAFGADGAELQVLRFEDGQIAGWAVRARKPA